MVEEARSTEMSIPGVMNLAAHHLKNNGSIRELMGAITELMQKLGYANSHHTHTS